MANGARTFIKVTNKDIYTSLEKLHDKLNSCERKIDGIDDMAATISKLYVKIEVLEKKIETLELKLVTINEHSKLNKTLMYGLYAVVALLIGILIEHIVT